MLVALLLAKYNLCSSLQDTYLLKTRVKQHDDSWTAFKHVTCDPATWSCDSSLGLFDRHDRHSFILMSIYQIFDKDTSTCPTSELCKTFRFALTRCSNPASRLPCFQPFKTQVRTFSKMAAVVDSKANAGSVVVMEKVRMSNSLLDDEMC